MYRMLALLPIALLFQISSLSWASEHNSGQGEVEAASNLPGSLGLILDREKCTLAASVPFG
jgi:hypothetical protein